MEVLFRSVATAVHRRADSERGATMVEYALLLALIALALVGALDFYGGQHQASWERIGSALP